MPRGDKSKYTDKQKRQAAHIESSEKKRGRSGKAAARIGWATVNKQDHGGKLSGSGRGGKRRQSRKSSKGRKANTSSSRSKRSTRPHSGAATRRSKPRATPSRDREQPVNHRGSNTQLIEENMGSLGPDSESNHSSEPGM